MKSILRNEWKLVLLCCLAIACIIKLFPLVNYHLQQTKEAKLIETGNYKVYFSNSQVDVVIFGTKSCRYCQLLREYLHANNIRFTDFDIESSARAAQQFKELRGKSVPLIVFRNQLIRGYSPELIQAKLNERIARANSELSTQK